MVKAKIGDYIYGTVVDDKFVPWELGKGITVTHMQYTGNGKVYKI